MPAFHQVAVVITVGKTSNSSFGKRNSSLRQKRRNLSRRVLEGSVTGADA